MIYAYTSAFPNKWSNSADLSATSGFYNVTTALAMMMGGGAHCRWAELLPMLVRVRSLNT
jgi:K+-transporting ATPase A subunit